ncbi:hypothetical protein BGX27_008891 [Mortierella sp. AM989]|nr:hypothetical protein BGX27_008891 [Mortierella sp. AM989]
MPFPNDNKKDKTPEVFDADEERRTFGQQSPYATPILPAQPIEPPTPTPVSPTLAQPSTASSTQPLTSPSVSSSSPQAQPQSQNAHSYNPQEGHVAMDIPPPAYEEVAQPRAPQIQYQPEQDSNSSPSVPLLGRPPTTEYSTIPIPRVTSRPTSVSGSSTSSTESQRSRKYDKFWLLFFLVVIVLLILDGSDSKGGSGDKCEGDFLIRRNLTDYVLDPEVVDFTVTMTNLPSYIFVEQEKGDEYVQGSTKFIIEASASDRDDLQSISHEIKQDYNGILKASITRTSNKIEPECLKTTVRIIFPPSMKRIRRLKFMVNEGNITVDLLNPGQEMKVDSLISTVITGHNHIRADVPTSIRLGGSVGTLTGEIVVRGELAANIVDGSVALNLIQSPGVLVSSKVNVINGDIKVGMVSWC